MSNDSSERDLDYICSAIGAFVLVALMVIWGIATWNGMGMGWKTLGIPGAIGVILLLPFNHLMRLVKQLKSMVPGVGP